ncbi:glycosyltransferase WbuB [Nocardiopsis gilva YIM 90087]|uniref:Glycosyltransferase WbuB n=1 Tax=Nocardiopsis gilva YIM 90087 TaxID=1235441 RepID=A0A223SD95_9ACTN|nr:glycosyltransferase family 4 protein [Nocardiopsis gilva]ASU86090.1 glycosyltransferase WbuB [Nocardiopsis gilva YIM 90087]
MVKVAPCAGILTARACARAADAYDVLVRHSYRFARWLPHRVTNVLLRLAWGPWDRSRPRLPAVAVLLLAAQERAEGARKLVPYLTARASERTPRGRRFLYRLAAVLSAVKEPRLSEAVLSRLSRLPARYEAPLRGALAYRSGQRLFEEGRISDALAEVALYADAHRFCGQLYRHLLGERAALGPLPVRPEFEASTIDWVPGRVLHLVSNALPHAETGYTVRTHRIATAQRDAGLDPHVTAFGGWPRGGVDTAERVLVDGIPYHRLSPGTEFREGLGPRIEESAREAADVARRLRPAALHAAADHRSGSVALDVGARLGVPVVYEVRGFLEEASLSTAEPGAEGSEHHRLVVQRESEVMRAADAVVAPSQTIREEIVARGVAPERVVLAPHPVDPALLDAAPDGAGFRREYGIGPEEFVVGAVSSIAPDEGFDMLIEAAALLRDMGVAVRVLLVGDGTARPRLLSLVEELGLEDTCVLPGRIGPEDARRAHAALDVFAVPRQDMRACRLTTPLEPVEAMALGRPVVASDLPALRELLAGGEAGVMVPPGDAETLAKALDRVQGDAELRRTLAEAGRAEVAAHRTWPRIAETYRDLYGSLRSG